MIKVVLKNEQDVTKFQQNLRTIRLQFPSWKDSKVHELAEIHILDKIHSKMREAVYSQKIIDGTKISRIDIKNKRARVFFISELFTESGYNIALGKEEGIKEFDVKDKLQVFEGKNGTVFTRKTHHPEIKGTKIIETVLAENEGTLTREYNIELLKWLKSNLQ